MRTYMESRTNKTINWHSRLKLLSILQKIKLDVPLRLLYVQDSANWIACACGNQCEVIKRHGDGRPIDEYLAYDGGEFHTHINNGNYKAAKQSLEAIEIRSAILIREELRKQSKT